METTPAGEVVRVLRSDGRDLHDGAPVAEAYFRHVVGLAFDANDDLLFSDSFGRVFRLDMATQTVFTVAGIAPRLIAENGPPLAAPIGPNGLALDGDALLFTDGGRIRRINPDGTLMTIAGSGLLTFPTTDVPATDAPLAPQSIELVDDGTLDYTDATAVHRIDAAGFVRLFAGRSPQCGLTGDGGPAREAMLCQPWASAHDRNGNVFIADTNNNRIRRVDAHTNVITTIAGNGGPVNGFEGYFRGTHCGDGGPALDACLNTPQVLALDRNDGTLYVTDRGSLRLRRIDPSGTITTFANGDFAALRVDAFGRVYANDGTRIVRFERDGAMTILAGNGEFAFGGDGGSARSAKLNRFSPSAGLVIDAEGNIVFSDSGNRRIRTIRYGAVLAPDDATISLSRDGARVRAMVRDGGGHPAPGVRVTFDAPASGASCRLAREATVTDANGIAETTCVPNCTPGAYSITARPAGSPRSATVGLSNTNDSCRRRTVRH